MNDDDSLFFRKAFQDVRPLKSSVSHFLHKPADPTPGQAYRRAAAQQAVGKEENFLPAAVLESVHPQEVLSFKRDGIQNGVFRSLQQGRYPIEATLDLHLLTIEQAREAVFQFVRDCQRYEVRLALINHGKGARRKDNQAVIKSCVARWLPMLPEVMAFHSAQRFHGGAGAVYVLMRKSETAKEKTRESLGLKSVKTEF
jgi:DNA-nicking Smr family endonuclease